MKVKLKDNKKPISIKSGWCFKAAGYDGDIVSEINSGKEVEVEFLPNAARELIEEINNTKKGDK